MSKVKSLIALTLIIALVIPFSVSADYEVNTIYFDDMEGLLMTRSQQIRDNNNSFGTSIGSKNQEAAIDDAITTVTSLLATVDEELDPALAYLLKAQLMSLEQQKLSLKGVDDLNEQLLLGTEMKNNAIIFSFESLYINIKNMEKQIELFSARVNSMKQQVEAMKLRCELGLVTEITVNQLANQLKSMEVQLEALKESRDGLLEQINVNIGQDHDYELNLADLPEVTEFQINSIDLTQDYELALLTSNSVRLAAFEDNKKEDDAKRKFKKDFYRTHQNLLDKQQALEVEKANMQVAEWNKKIADIKFELGMISSLDYEDAKNTYLDSKVTLEIANNNLFSAYHQYKWAKRGFVFISSTGV